MKRKLLTLLLSLFIVQGAAFSEVLKGFAYGEVKAPIGDEWESPQKIALNKEQPHAWFFNFENIENARKVLPENSAYSMSLDGTWNFSWVPTPEKRPKDFYKIDFDASAWDKVQVPMNWNVYGIEKDGTQKYGTPVYVNQPVIFMHSVRVDDWKGGVMRTPPTSWTTYKDRNEVGSYRRSFFVPENWDGRQVFINFEGVDSFFYLWINGEYVGFSKNSRNLASFNITKYLQKGENIVAAEVYRNSDGSFLEAQDMFRLPGIFRPVYLTSTSGVHINDLVVKTQLDDNYKNACLSLEASIRNLSRSAVKNYSISYKLYANKLYSDENTLVSSFKANDGGLYVDKNSSVDSKIKVPVINPNKWSAETPNRYTLIAQLKDKKGKVVETVSLYFGFREVTIKDTPASEDEFGLAGRYFYVNGKTVKLKGVNRHESSPSRGHAVTNAQMFDEVMLMKKGNINHVRTSHYPDNPYFYYLTDKYGIYLESEANIESHEYYYGEASLSHPIEWRDAHVARNMEMVHANVNIPSIVIWSLGNEAGPGKNFVSAYNAIKDFDLTRPIQYERNNNIVDMGSNQYPSIAWVNGAVKGTYDIKYPFHISEYAHSMGNAGGNLSDYWKAIESTNFFCGGAIWDWVDQALYNYDPATGKRYLAYGGDFGDTPNDGMFVMNGVVFADLTPKPEFAEVKKVYQNIGVKALDMRLGNIEIFNKNYFISLDKYNVNWSLLKNGREIECGVLDFPTVNARQKVEVSIPYDYSALEENGEYFVNVQFVQKKAQPWAPAGYVQAEEQLLVKKAEIVSPVNASINTNANLKVIDNNRIHSIEGNDFNVVFNDKTGTIQSLYYRGRNVIADGNGPKLDAFRAPVDNDNWAMNAWLSNGLSNLQHKVLSKNSYRREDGAEIITYVVESKALHPAHFDNGRGKHFYKYDSDKEMGPEAFKFTTSQVWTVYPDGSIELEAGITSNKPSLALPCLGYEMVVSKDLDHYTYYGRGPVNNYNDRCSGSFMGLYKQTVEDQFMEWPKPQNMSNREDARWCALSNNEDEGLIFVATTGKMSISALAYSELELTKAAHSYQLPEPGNTHLKLCIGATGLGGNSCGQGGPLREDRIMATPHNFGFIIRPTNGSMVDRALVSAAGEKPISIMRNKRGDITILSQKEGAKILYTVDDAKKSSVFTESFNLRAGGKVKAWYADNDKLVAEQTFSKIESVPLEVVYASSEEGNTAKNLVDGDPSTVWHTMYSVTVAKYPHWVDLDMGEEKMVSGFTYLPRSSGSNGDIKDYEIYVSMDGKIWGNVVAKGQFKYNKKNKRVIFKTSVKGRYLRFKALSSQDGQDFASGAEVSVVVK